MVQMTLLPGAVMRAFSFLLLIFTLGGMVQLRAADEPDGTAFTHTVLSVDGPDLIRIRYCGVPMQVRVANVLYKGKDSEAASAKYLKESLKPGSQVRIELETELGGDSVPPASQVFSGNTHLNLDLIKRGLAISDGRSRKFSDAFQSAQTDAMNQKQGIWANNAATPAPPAHQEPVKTAEPAKVEDMDAAPKDYNGPVVADLNSKEYQLPGSRFAKSIRPGARIEYKSPEEAERAGKMPSPFSFPERAKALADKHAASQPSSGGSSEQVVDGARKSLTEALQFMSEARRLSRTDGRGANDNWKKAAKILSESIDRLTPVADANPTNVTIQKLAEEMTMNLYSCNKYQSL
jgi:hypothetical protein